MSAEPDAGGRARLVAVARGDAEPDAVVEGGRVFCSFTREWLEGDVALVGGRIAGVGSYEGGERLDARGRHVVPGLVDAHVHVESSKLAPDEFASVLVRHGTTTAVVDPHELANVLGVEGVLWLLDACAGLPVDVRAMVPSCVPASPFESPRAPLALEDMRRLLAHPRMLGVAELMNFPAVVAGEPSALAKLGLPGGEHVDGHAPGLLGRELDAYLAAGVSSDHEAVTYEEAIARRRRGAWVLLREASNAHNLRDLLPLVRERGADWCAFCTDDVEPDTLLREGGIDHMCRIAVAEGIAVEDVLLLASTNGARCHGLHRVGAIAPGWAADLLVLDDLSGFAPRHVVSGGVLRVADGELLPFARAPAPAGVRDTVHAAPVAAASFAVASSGAPVRVIELVRDQLLTRAAVERPAVQDGAMVADPSRDLALLAVVERHHASGRIGHGVVRGFGLRRGAIATTVAHDAHNIVVVGTAAADMAAGVTRLAEIGGGIVVIDAGRVLAELSLPIAGLMSDAAAEAVVARLDELHAAVRRLGGTLDAPFTALSFLALSVIPSLKLTDRGLVDVDRFALVPLEV